MLCSAIASASSPPPQVVVEAEEEIYRYAPANNGAGPLWCYGATCIVRHGQEVIVCGLETIPEAKPLNNCRWTLFRRTDKGWQLVQKDDRGRQREPCPIGLFHDGRLFLSTNPTLTLLDQYDGPANPHLLQLSLAELAKPGTPLQPLWTRNSGFNEHSYRGLGVDAARGELVLMNNFGYDEQYWTFLDRRGRWSNCGIIHYPIRGCYQQIALLNGACHVLAIGDVVEPVEEWRQWKFETTQREWDYVFRRLFYVWNPKIAKKQFAEPIEIDNLDATAGHISNLDLWIDRRGDAHLLYRKSTVQTPVLRDRFFPGTPITHSLEHCVVRKNKVISRQTLLVGGEGSSSEVPGWARFHATPDGRLFVFYHCSGADAKGQPLNENRILEILPGGKVSEPARLALARPLTNLMTATERGGSPPSQMLDLLGTAADNAMRYVRVRFR